MGQALSVKDEIREIKIRMASAEERLQGLAPHSIPSGEIYTGGAPLSPDGSKPPVGQPEGDKDDEPSTSTTLDPPPETSSLSAPPGPSVEAEEGRDTSESAGLGSIHGEDGPRPQAYALKTSTWDTLMLVFLPGTPVSAIDSLVALVLFLANLVVQVLFTLLIVSQAAELKEEGEKILQDALEWRLGPGHHVKHYDEVTNTSLVTRVCADYGADVISSKQMDVYKEIDSYLEGYGPLLTCLAVFVWTVGVCKDLRQVWEFVSAVMSAKREGSTECVRRGDTKYSVEKLSISRTMVVVSAAILRFCVAVGLWYAGMLWLTYTVKMSDIITNAVALGFVFDIDELLYNLVPRDLDSFLQNLEPLPLPTMRRKSPTPRRQFWFNRPDARSLSLVTLLFVVMGTWSMTTATPFEQQLEASRHLFCGGETNFVYQTDPATHAVKTAETLTNDEFNDRDLSTSTPELFRAVWQRTKLRKVATELKSVEDVLIILAEEGSEQFHEEMVSEVKELQFRQVSDAIQRQPCKNLDDTEPLRRGMRSAVQDDNCSTLVQDGGCSRFQVRVFCPQFCNCTDAGSGMFSRYGCSSQCDVHYQQSLTQLQWEAEIAVICWDLLGTADRSSVHAFFADLQEHLLARGDLERVSGGIAFTELLKTSFQRRTGWFLENTTKVNITGWWQESKPMHFLAPVDDCQLALYLDVLFDTNLCEADAAGGFGTLAPFCRNTCGLCGRPKKEVQMNIMANDLKTWNGDDDVIQHLLLPYMPSAINLDGTICNRTGAAMRELIPGEMPEPQLFAFTAQHGGQYAFRVIGDDRYDTILSVWSGTSFRLFQLSDNATGLWQDPCITMDVDAGDKVVLVVESMNYSKDGTFTLVVECPWSSSSRKLCPGGSEYLTFLNFSLHAAACSSMGLYEVLEDQDDGLFWQVQHFVAAVVSGASYAPIGLSYDTLTDTVHFRGTGRQGTQCGERYQCICSPEEPNFNRLPTACDKAVQGACKVCVEEMDSHCGDNAWDQMCVALCSRICEPVCEVLPLDVDGECSLSHSIVIENQTEEYSLASGNFEGGDSSYFRDIKCTFLLGLKKNELRSYGPLRVDYFLPRSSGDTLIVDGVAYRESQSPHGVVPNSTITWASDSSTKRGAGYGWRMSLNVTRTACIDRDDECADRAKNSWRCVTRLGDSVNLKRSCCHCGGGSYD